MKRHLLSYLAARAVNPPDTPDQAVAARRSPHDPTPHGKFMKAFREFEADAFNRGFATALSRFQVMAAEPGTFGARVKAEVEAAEAEWRRLTNCGQSAG